MVADNNSICIVISTLLVSYLMKKLNFEPTYYGMLHGLVLQLLMWITIANFDWINNISLWNIIYIAIIFVGGYFMSAMLKKYLQNEYVTINIYSEADVNIFIQYIKFQSDYYNVSVDTNIGDIDKISELALYGKNDFSIMDQNIMSQCINTRVNFVDTYLNIEGYFIWRKETKQSRDKDNVVIKTCTIKYIEFNMLKKVNTDINPTTIYNRITEYVIHKNKDMVKLQYIKIIANDGGPLNHIVKFYEGEKEPFEVLETKFMKSMFHQEKDRLWAVIKQTCLNPDFYKEKGQIGKISLLLHGPPGTGKSTFAFRIAMILQRNIISLDLRSCSKSSIYQILHKPGHCTSYKDAVFLFEEFDNSINELYLREKRNKDIMNKYHEHLELFDIDDIKDNKDNKDNKNSEHIKKIYDMANNDFTLRDLLEIFQGPIPFESMIIIANTNKYNEIHSMCPELFRPGRLTPVYFGYINKETVQDISKYFFGKKLTGYLPDVLSVPTSQIIDLALESSTCSNDPFDYFTEKLNRLLTQ